MKVAVIKTMQTMFVGAAAVLTLQAAVLVTPASAQYSGYSGYSQSAQNQDAAITRGSSHPRHRRCSVIGGAAATLMMRELGRRRGESQEVVELALKGLLRATGARDSARLIVKLVRPHVPAAR